LTETPWRAPQFSYGYSGEFLPPGQRTWRMVKEKGAPKIFATRREAWEAAKDAWFRIAEPEIRATMPVDPSRIANKLGSEAESWLKSKREDRRATTEVRRPGKRVVVVMRGRA